MLYDPMNDYDERGKVYLKAAQYIEENGWCQGSFLDPMPGSEAVCTMGALSTAIAGHPFRFAVITFAVITTNAVRILECEDEIKKKLGTRLIGTWNDRPERTVDEILRLFRELAEAHRLVKAEV